MPDVWTWLRPEPWTQQELPTAAAELKQKAGAVRLWWIEGDMGAGKTTLIKEVCRQLGVTETMSSPTFSIINQYRAGTGEPVYHFDFYRLKSEAEAMDIGVEEYFDSGFYCFVEWPERAAALFAGSYFRVNIQHHSDHTRTIAFAHV